MNLKNIGSNMTLITMNGGAEYMFSYETLVAGYAPDDISETENGYWFVGESPSRTTTTHSHKYLETPYTPDQTTHVHKYDAALVQVMY